MEMSSIRRFSSLLIVFLQASLFGQSLKIQPSVVRKGEAGSIHLILDAPVASAPAALQFDLIPPPDVTTTLNDLVIDGAPESVNKSLVCVDKRETPQRYSCTIAGGSKTIPNGPIVSIRYRIAVEVRKAAGKVRIEKAMGVKSDGSPLNFPNEEQTLSIK